MNKFSKCASINLVNSAPTANLTVNKNRVKIYDNNTYYLQDGQTFEIELFNPTQHKIKADITLDGQLISAGGLVLKPGERVYLERFVDTDNKFVFETYEVEDTQEVNDAISDNGKLEIKFYNEEVNLWIQPSLGQWQNTLFYCTNPLTTNIGTTFNYTDTTGWNTTIDADGNSTCCNYNQDISGVLRSSTMETGRTEKGEASGQTFTNDYSTFSSFPSGTVEYKILPISKQPITKKELNVKRYCTECGSKCQAKFKFCPSCGDKL